LPENGATAAFGGKGAARAAKASKWHHVLFVAERLLHDAARRLPLRHAARSSRAQPASHGIRLLFLDADNLATRHLGQWLQRTLHQAVGKAAGQVAATSATAGTRASTIGRAIASVLGGAEAPPLYPPLSEPPTPLRRHLLVARGRAALGEPFNLGAFVVLLDAEPDAGAGGTGGAGGAGNASHSAPGSRRRKEPAALRCLRAAAAVAEASSVGTARFRPRLNDQEALRRVLSSAAASRSGGPPGEAAGPAAARCSVGYLPAEMQRFAASGAAWLFTRPFRHTWPAGLVHCTRAKQRLAGCPGAFFVSMASPPPPPTKRRGPMESGAQSHGNGGSGFEEHDDDALLSWKQEEQHRSGRRARAWWIVLWRRAQSFFWPRRPPEAECWGTYQPLLKALLKQERAYKRKS
jgi:hypothetical protein